MKHFLSRLHFLQLASAAFVFVGAVGPTISAEEAAPDFSPPKPLTDSHFEALRAHSPFTRILNFSDEILLTGVAMIDGEPVATLRNRKKGESFVISGQPNDEGWKMVSVEATDELGQVTATFFINENEKVTLQFEESQLHPTPKRRGIDAIQASEKNARRPPPTDEERRKFGEWVRGRMSKMSDAQKKRVGQLMQEKMKANPKWTDRQKGEVFVKILDFVESENR